MKNVVNLILENVVLTKQIFINLESYYEKDNFLFGSYFVFVR